MASSTLTFNLLECYYHDVQPLQAYLQSVVQNGPTLVQDNDEESYRSFIQTSLVAQAQHQPGRAFSYETPSISQGEVSVACLAISTLLICVVAGGSRPSADNR